MNGAIDEMLTGPERLAKLEREVMRLTRENEHYREAVDTLGQQCTALEEQRNAEIDRRNAMAAENRNLRVTVAELRRRCGAQ